jgi:hypothetical protein
MNNKRIWLLFSLFHFKIINFRRKSWQIWILVEMQDFLAFLNFFNCKRSF